MRFVMMLRATTESPPGVPSQRILSELGRYSQDLVKAGVLLASEGLYPGSECVRIRFSGGKRIVIDGPPKGASQLVAAFWLVQVRSRDEVLEWARRCPTPVPGDSEIEVRRCVDPDDADDVLAREVRRREKRRSDGRA
jgi:hypothetical protein